MSTFLIVLYALIILDILVIVHEFGHLFAARSIGTPVIAYAIGMGPTIARWKWRYFGETEFRLAVFPIGGYCLVSGEEEESGDPNSLYNKTPWQRIWYSAAGVVLNFVLAIIVFFSVFAIWGTDVAIMETNQVSFVELDKPAEEAGIGPRDRILSIDGQYIYSYEDIANNVNGKINEDINVTVGVPKDEITLVIGKDDVVKLNLSDEIVFGDIDLELDTQMAGVLEFNGTIVALESLERIGDEDVPTRIQTIETTERDFEFTRLDWDRIEEIIDQSNGDIELVFAESLEVKDLTITTTVGTRELADGTEEEYGKIGVMPWFEPVRMNLWESLVGAFKSFWNIIAAFWAFFVGLFAGKTDGLGGPVAIGRMVGQATYFGVGKIISFAGTLSVSLGFINLVPFPGLDGGHIVFNFVEGITGKKLNRNVLNAINFVGFIILILLIILIFGRDLLNVFNW
ncbi:MAG TPA: RIP metalloprotease RseP [Caldisericia bacterium]|nr:RIP metalloprotease RseP [Caldisericia bacterium]HPF49584.1 RIP metalloprotease RseP [Caldisericia bacterium]HPI84500.1 RIP metalloprotease RseP [Caldisericia bacterium]HPQ93866.1 RIP metalloprotease RseP [Caldisericia bacterium]HRV75411.1 RIP metalloprotease RseP [Caldisericia bacterium]